jgi:hypothetical protein
MSKEIREWINKRSKFGKVRIFPSELAKELKIPEYMVLFTLEWMRSDGEVMKCFALVCTDCDDVVRFSEERCDTFKCLVCGDERAATERSVRSMYEVLAQGTEIKDKNG